MPEHAPDMGWHHDLHVWVAEENPSGVFAMFNPTISCRGETWKKAMGRRGDGAHPSHSRKT